MKKVAVITGGSSGIGLATLNLLKEKGYEVVSVSRSSGCDISKPEDIKKTAKELVSKYGHIDVLVNNAGIMDLIPLEDTTLEDWDNMMNVNLRSVFLFIRELLPYMRGGSIVSVSSSAGRRGRPGWMAYSVSKAGIITITQSLSEELKDITINCVCPGRCDTYLRNHLFPDEDKSTLLKPEEVAEKIVELAESGETGQIIDLSKNPNAFKKDKEKQA